MRKEGRIAKAAAMVAGTIMAACGTAMADDGMEAPLLTRPAMLADAPPARPQQHWADRWKKPVSWLEWGADVRLRHEQLINAFSLDRDHAESEWSFERLRARIWGTIHASDDIDVNARLTWEGRHYWLPENSRDEWEESELVVDNLNVKFKNITMGDTTSTLTLGRQDIIFGDGWLVLEGTPLDGSRTIFFDAARLNINMKEAKTAVDLVFIEQAAETNEIISPIWSDDLGLREQDERGAILYITNKSIERTSIEPYFMYKHSEAEQYERFGINPATGRFDKLETINGDNADLYTVGARVTHDFNKNWKGLVEGAYQFGNRDNPSLFGGTNEGDVNAWGMRSNLTYMFNDDWKNQISLCYEYLSGDDPGTQDVEQFDSLWARWPQWSELIVYHYATDTRIAEVTNLHRVAVGWQADPIKNITLMANYHALFADQNTRAGQGGPGFDGNDNFRGHLFTAEMRYKINRFWSGHFRAEHFIPGEYYSTPRDDSAWFLRAEVVFTF